MPIPRLKYQLLLLPLLLITGATAAAAGVE